MLLVLGGQCDLLLSNDIVLRLIILGRLSRVRRLLALMHNCLRRHLLFGPYVKWYLRLDLSLKVLIEDT